MAKNKFEVSLDLNYNELLKARLEILTSSQRTALNLSAIHQGYAVFDSTENKPYWWNGTVWITTGIGGSGTTIYSSSAMTAFSQTNGFNSVSLNFGAMNGFSNTLEVKIVISGSGKTSLVFLANNYKLTAYSDLSVSFKWNSLFLDLTGYTEMTAYVKYI